jgi:hypothetical protein
MIKQALYDDGLVTLDADGLTIGQRLTADPDRISQRPPPGSAPLS